MTTATAQGPLYAATMATLRAYFARADHRPSEDHWAALGDVIETMECMATGVVAPKMFLSAVDCGIGKSTTVLHFVRALLASKMHHRVGVIVCVGRLSEAREMAEALEDHAEQIAVLTSDQTINALGRAPTVDAAQVLVTTQQRLERTTARSGFNGAVSLYYCGKPRAVRVWDEAWLPGKVAAVRKYDLYSVIKPLARLSRDCAREVERFVVTIDTYGEGDLIDVPDFIGSGALHDLQASLNDTQTDPRAATEGLIMLSGTTARVLKDGTFGNTVLTYQDTLPEDLKPLLVLDASGRVRETYAQMHAHRGDIVRLQSAVKNYTPLTIGVWPKSGSKSGFERDGETLVRGVAETVLTKPDEEWLIVTHRKVGKLDVVKKIKAALRGKVTMKGEVDGGKVAFLTWGAHMATNAHASVPNLILAGTLFMSESYYVGLSHLAQDRAMAEGFVAGVDVDMIRRGEHRHLILQALCRGRVRKCDGPQCHAMSAYIIAASSSGIGHDLPSVFPGCVVRPWQPIRPTLKGPVKQAVDYVKHALARAGTTIPLRVVAAAIKVQPSNLRRAVTSKPAWAEEIEALGLETICIAHGAKALRRRVTAGATCPSDSLRGPPAACDGNLGGHVA